MSTVIIVQARMTSTRLPGKVLKTIAGRPMLSYQLERLRQVQNADQLVIATTTNKADEAIVALCVAEGVACTRGSEHDVLSRYHEAATRFRATTVVRVTSDCPLLDPGIVDAAITSFFEPPGYYDYASNMIEPTYPYGMSVEVMSAHALHEAHLEATDPQEREHVTPFIYWRSDRFRVKSLTMQPNLSNHRWTVDTPEDFLLVSRILDKLYPVKPHFVMSDVLELLAGHPDWASINRHVKQHCITQPTK